MSIGKVILVVLATLVIFSTGLVTGLMVMKQLPKPAMAPAGPPVPPAAFGMQQFLDRIQGELDLTPEQHEHIAGILRESQERARGMARGEFGKVREQIRAELKPGQREKFEQLLRQRQRRMQEMRSQENRPGFRPNGPAPDASLSPEGPRPSVNNRTNPPTVPAQ